MHREQPRPTPEKTLASAALGRGWHETDLLIGFKRFERSRLDSCTDPLCSSGPSNLTKAWTCFMVPSSRSDSSIELGVASSRPPRLRNCARQSKFAGHRSRCIRKRLRLALPYYDDAPSRCMQRGTIARIPRDIRFELGSPELAIAFRKSGLRAPFVPMPIATVHEYDRFPLRQHHVRGAG